MDAKPDKSLEIRRGNAVRLNPLISVIIPAYNCAKYISESVEAVLSQTLEDFELIVVNDGSADTPELESALEPYFERMTYIRRENGGAGAARNSGIRVARGEFLGFVDGDDVWYPEFLEKQLDALREKGCDMINCDALYFGDTPPGVTFFSHSPGKGPVTTESLIRGTTNLILSGTLIRKAPVIEFGMFRDHRLELAYEDYELWFRLCKNGVKIDYNKEILLRYRVHESNSSGSFLKVVERGLVSGQFIKDNFDLNESELRAVSDREKYFSSQMAIEKAKIQLAHGNYADSIRLVGESAGYMNSARLRLIAAVLRFNPSFLRTVFKTFRPREFERALKETTAF